MQLDQHPSRSASAARPASSAYLMSWVAVAAFGLGYIGVAATRPDLLGVILPISDQQNDQVIAGRTAADVADELATLRKWVHDVQHELAAAKSALQEQSQQQQALLQRVAAAEDRLAAVATKEVRTEGAPARPGIQRLQTRTQAQPPQASTQAAAPAAPAEPRVAQAPTQSQAQAAQGVSEAASTLASNVRVLNNAATAAAPIATGSVPDAGQTAAGFGQPKVTPAAPAAPRAIEIGSSDSLEGLRAKWGDIAARNPEVVGEAAPRYRLSADGRQAPFTLLAGPYDAADAARACAALKAKGVACRVSSYGGNAF